MKWLMYLSVNWSLTTTISSAKDDEEQQAKLLHNSTCSNKACGVNVHNYFNAVNSNIGRSEIATPSLTS
ncbi:hypothetical protein BT93_E2147 [Corymbia citriodora subsp. variegata]|nr:hypothetical protein BT93_E2147 [Corymbia citriodora subsp. variegata]